MALLYQKIYIFKRIIKSMKILITGPACPHCHNLKEKLKDKIEKGEVIEKSIDTDEGADLVLKYNILKLPTLLECDEKEKVCKIVQQGE